MVVAEEIERQIEMLRARIEELERENKILREENAILKRGQFGRSTQWLTPGQLGLFLGELDGQDSVEPPKIEVPARKRTKPVTLG